MLEDCTEEESAEELKEARIEERMSSCSVEGPWLGPLAASSLTLSSCGAGPWPSREGCWLGTRSSCSPEFHLLHRESGGWDGKRGSLESCLWGDRSRTLRGGGRVLSHSQGVLRSRASRDPKRPARALGCSLGGCLRGRVLPRSLGSRRPGAVSRCS